MWGGEGDILEAPEKQYSGEIPCNFLVLMLCTHRYISFKKKTPGRLGHIIWGNTAMRPGKTIGTDDYNSFYYYYYCSYFYGVSHANETEILRVHIILVSIFFLIFFLQPKQGTGIERGWLSDCRKTVWLTNIFSAHLDLTMKFLPLCCLAKY